MMATGHSIRALYALIFIFVGGYGNFFPLWLTHEGWEGPDIGWLTASKYVAIIVFPTIWGRFADRWGSRIKTLRLLAVISAVAFIPIVFSSDFWVVFISIAVFAAFRMGIIPVTDTHTLAHIDAHGGDYGRFRLWGSAGFVAGGFIVGGIVSHYSRSVIPLALATLCALTVLLVFSLPQDRLTHRKSAPTLLSTLRAHPMMIRFLVVIFMWRLCGQGLYLFLPIHLADLGVVDTLVPAYWAIGVIAEIGLLHYAKSLFGRFSTYFTLNLCLLACVAQYGLMAFVDDALWLYPVMMFHGFTFGVAYYTAVLWLGDNMALEQRATAQGLFQSISFGIGGALSSIAAGYLFAFGRGPAMFGIAACGAVLTLLVSLVILRKL